MDGFQEAAQPHGCPGQQEDREAQEPLWTQEIPDCTACHQRHTGSHHPLAPLLINELWPTSRSSPLLPGTAASSLWSDTNRNVTYMKSLETPPKSSQKHSIHNGMTQFLTKQMSLYMHTNQQTSCPTHQTIKSPKTQLKANSLKNQRVEFLMI